MKAVNILEKLNLFQDRWSPKIIASLNGQDVKLAKLKGEFIWHDHAEEDELFMVIRGRLTIEFRDRKEIVNEGEIIIVPRGVEHRPVAEEEVHVLLFEPSAIKHTGDVLVKQTVESFDRI